MAPNFRRSVIVEEGKTLNMSCSATGNPTPQVEWRRDDGRTINVNGIESEFSPATLTKFSTVNTPLLYSTVSSISGQFIKFTNITRHQMAAYTCHANNGIAPVANATFLVEVHCEYCHLWRVLLITVNLLQLHP